jgi:hypothetical protein
MSDDEKHLKLKSISHSANNAGLTWCLLTTGIKKYSVPNSKKRILCLYRSIAYINAKNEVHLIGYVYIPLLSIKNILLYFGLLLSRKTFGHYIKNRFNDNISITLIEKVKCDVGTAELWFGLKTSEISRRRIDINNSNRFFYAEEIYN